MPQGTPLYVTEKSEQRAEMVKVLITLSRGQIEDLELIGRYRHGQRSRSVLVREAVAWLVAREAASLVRYRDAENRRKQREALEAHALVVASSERDRQKLQDTLTEARKIATGAHHHH